MSGAQPILGIIAGSGRLPAQLAEACRTSGRPCFVLTFEEDANIDAIENMPHAIVRLGAISEALDKLRGAQVSEVVLAGRVKRPSLSSLRPDMAATRLLTKLGTAFLGGDDALLKALMKFMEEEGFKVIGAQEILRSLVAVEGVYGRVKPDAQDEKDIALGLAAAKKLGELDIGQAAIVENGYVLGLEAAEGTNALIERCTGLKRQARAGVLVKAKKPAQDERADLPAIGVETVENVHRAGLKGIAVEAGGSIVLERDKVAARADELGVFVAGIRHG